MVLRSQIATSRLSWLIRDALSQYGVIILFCIFSFILGFLRFRAPANDGWMDDIHTLETRFRLSVNPIELPTETVQTKTPSHVYWKTVFAKITAYTPDYRSCGRFSDGRTSIGHNAWKMDGVAADPRAVPYGTLVEIPQIGLKEVDDTGSGMKRSWRRGQYHFDVRMPYNYRAKRWGVRWLHVKLYRRVKS